MLNIEETKNSGRHEEEKKGDEREETRRRIYYELLTHAGYMEKHPGGALRRDVSNVLTAAGFSFILQEPSTQVHDVLWHYMGRAANPGPGGNRMNRPTTGPTGEKSPVVETL